MASDVTMPRLSDSMEEGTVLKWLVEEGGEVKRGEPLVEIETDKANMTYDADTDGVLVEIVAQEGDTLAIGEVIARIGEAGEAKGSGGGEAEESAAKRRTPAVRKPAARTRPTRARATRTRTARTRLTPATRNRPAMRRRSRARRSPRARRRGRGRRGEPRPASDEDGAGEEADEEAAAAEGEEAAVAGAEGGGGETQAACRDGDA